MFIFLFIYALLLVYVGFILWVIYGLNKANKPINTITSNRLVSIIIPCRNEEKTILKCLDSIIHQEYEEWEIIVVDDHSTDKTNSFVQEFIKVHSHSKISLYSIEEGVYGKKSALEYGISKANGSLILTTDADCEYPTTWIKRMVNYLETTQLKMLAGPVLYKKTQGILDSMLNFELLSLITTSAGLIKNKFPLMVSGANLLFEKSAFFEVGKYESHKKIASGDDVFLLFDFKKKFSDKIDYLFDKEALVRTDNPVSFTHFINQRIRWASKATHYPFGYTKLIPLLILCINVLQLLIYFLWVLQPALLIFILIKGMVEILFFNQAQDKLGLKRNYFIFGLTFLIYPFYLIFISAMLPFKKNFIWKDRRMVDTILNLIFLSFMC